MELLNLACPVALQKMLVCVDDSAESAGAFTAGLTLARSCRSKLFLLQVVEIIPGYELYAPDLMPPSPQPDLEFLKLREETARRRLEKWQNEAANQGVDLEIRVHCDTAADIGILEEAEEIQPQLIIMGRHGRTGLDRMVMGSVTAKTISHSLFNVLVVPGQAVLDFKRILIASDGSLFSAAAWEEALSITRIAGSSLIGVSVARDDSAVSRTEETLRQMEEAAARAHVPLETQMLRGRPFEAILNAASMKEVDLIILGSHGRTGLKRLLLGSVAERVIGLSACPVLVVKKK
ncbi:MAG: universal stress protein [Thermodesulfobacteriota bacterium]